MKRWLIAGAGVVAISGCCTPPIRTQAPVPAVSLHGQIKDWPAMRKIDLPQSTITNEEIEARIRARTAPDGAYPSQPRPVPR